MSIRVLALITIVMTTTGINNIYAGDWDNRTVYTANGIVKFVSNDVKPETLAEMLFHTSKKTPLTRSIFDEPSEGGVSIAMLINFEFDSSDITAESEELLDVIGVMLNMDESLEKELIVEGHTDIIGSAEYNMNLSFRRAESVLRYLISEHDISSDRLSVSGKGESELIDPTAPKSAINRRVQFEGA